MKRLVFAVLALAVISISSCKKEEGATPEIKNETTKVAAKDLSAYD
ncbi:MAG TPA: hypothetical protein VEV16_01255 [Daejeonella sp.]|nr:hypothetical protein [Daejeonella sp.]